MSSKIIINIVHMSHGYILEDFWRSHISVRNRLKFNLHFRLALVMSES